MITQNSVGRALENNLELLTTAILSHWKPIDFEENESTFNSRFMLYGQSGLGFEYLY